MKPWDIYLAYVHYEGIDGGKKRPVVILSETTAFVIGLGIYSASPRPMMNDYMIRDWKAAGLDHQSTIQLDRKIRIQRDDVAEKIGELSPTDILLVKHYL